MIGIKYRFTCRIKSDFIKGTVYVYVLWHRKYSTATTTRGIERMYEKYNQLVDCVKGIYLEVKRKHFKSQDRRLR